MCASGSLGVDIIFVLFTFTLSLFMFYLLSLLRSTALALTCIGSLNFILSFGTR
jgi:hypothetical protein